MTGILGSFGKFISWIATPLVAMCPLCTFTAAFIALGQVTFLFAIARVLVPILLGLILISVFSFYLSYRSHHNLYPLIAAVVGGSLLIYSNSAALVNVLYQVGGILILSSAALVDLNIRLSRQRGCEACEGTDKAHSH